MKTKKGLQDYIVLEQSSQEIKELLRNSSLQCERKVTQLLTQYPDAPQPQNLLGIIAEVKGDKVLAMKHYRAAWALAPDYRPAHANIERLVDMEYHREYYFHDQDIENMENRKKQRDFHIIRRRLG
ncbi:hypothetical protein [Candidatus Stoquefichus sp. SB1]|uniref:hypothetical protein n=1 Tax=Candidatus Stoquefichus sp. SB1 TaxID=1658109 RepID=UPI00067EC674|nr:hypothetical protein [Candidatus Stoquefichus sp. SB1]